jgi:ribosome maturation factor RimP
MTLQEAEEQIVPVLKKTSFSLVELSLYKKKGRSHLQLVAYGKNGITLDDCVSLHKLLFPRLEMSFEQDNIYLEISSPGIGRKIKSNAEYSVFIGRWVGLLLIGEDQWIKGVIESADDKSVTLKIDEETRIINYDSIQKGKLDFDKEMR